MKSLIDMIGVKSVQRGYGDITRTNGSITIDINAVNPEKSIFMLNDGMASSNYYTCITDVTATSFNIRFSLSSSGTKYSWQVIEFY